jgi:hypothetical protein
LAGYCATKGGVRLFAKAVAMECAAAGDGIRVNTVHPGVIDTPIWTKIAGSAGRNVPLDPNEIAKSGVPFGRAWAPQDIANGVLFLASAASNDMPGAELVIDGGMTAGARPRSELTPQSWRGGSGHFYGDAIFFSSVYHPSRRSPGPVSAMGTGFRRCDRVFDCGIGPPPTNEIV